MSVEQKVKELLDRANGGQLTEESTENLAAGSIADVGAKAAANMKKDTSKAGMAATAGDTTSPKQGSSQDASIQKQDEDDENQGAKAAAAVSKDSTLPTSKGDAKSVKTAAMEETIVEEDTMDIQSQLNTIFGEELSEEFKTKASSIFEAVVIARVNNEMEKITQKLEEQNSAQLVEYKETLVQKVDSYLNYVVEQWMEENQLSIESGLRTEVAEDFISGMQKLFKEHYIEVPEEKYDVMQALETDAQELQKELDETINEAIELKKELNDLKKNKILEEQTKDLAATEIEKLKKLVEGIEFDTEDLFKEKVAVIKENYFPKAAKTSPEQSLVQETGTGQSVEISPAMSRYVQALSKSVKR